MATSKQKVILTGPMKPNIDVVRAMGIKLTEMKTKSSSKYTAVLPEGWSAQKTKGNISTEIVIYDDKNRARVHCSQVAANFLYIAKSETRVYRRYSVQVINRHDNHPEGNFEVILCKIEPSFENQGPRLIDDIVFNAGRTRIEPQYDNNIHTYSRSHSVVRACAEYADHNFPDWMNPEAYWD